MELKHVVIAGATGVVGASLVTCMVEHNVRVTVIIRPGSAREKNLPADPLVKKVYCSLENLNKLEKGKIEPCDAFYYLAWDGAAFARNDARYQMMNVGYLLDAVQLAGELGAVFIGAGSQAEYGVYNEKRRSEDIPDPVSAYGIAKMSAQKLGKIYAEQSDIPFIWTRIFSIYGPYDLDKTLVMSCIRALHEKRSVELTRCEQYWDYLYAADAAEAYYKIGMFGIKGKIYNICSGKIRKLEDYVREIEKTYLRLYPAGGKLMIGAKEYGKDQCMFQGGDIAELSHDTGFFPAVSFEEGIYKTLQWYCG